MNVARPHIYISLVELCTDDAAHDLYVRTSTFLVELFTEVFTENAAQETWSLSNCSGKRPLRRRGLARFGLARTVHGKSALTECGLAKSVHGTEKMSYFQEDLNDNPFFSDETEEDEDEEDKYSLDSQSSHVLRRSNVVFESDTDEEDSFAEEARYNPSRPAYHQLPLGKAENPEIVQPCRQARINSKKRKGRRQNVPKPHQRGVAWGSPVKNQYPQQQFERF